MALIPGFELRPSRLQFGTGVPIGLSGNAETWGVVVDVQFDF